MPVDREEDILTFVGPIYEVCHRDEKLPNNLDILAGLDSLAFRGSGLYAKLVRTYQEETSNGIVPVGP